MDDMDAVFTEDVLTPLTFEEAARAMRAALKDAIRSSPSDPVLALALAKTALETGRWTSIHCSNWGNVKAGPRYAGMYTSFKCNEVLGGKVVWFAPEGQLSSKDGILVGKRYDVPPGHPQTRFRAYANEFDGAYEYVEFVASGRYVDAWKELLEGDAAGYVQALHRKGYFTADPAVYSKAVVSLQKEFEKRLSGSGIPDEEVEDYEFDRLRAMIRGGVLNIPELSQSQLAELVHPDSV